MKENIAKVEVEDKPATQYRLDIKPRSDNYALTTVGVWLLLIASAISHFWIAHHTDFGDYAIFILILGPGLATKLKNKEMLSLLSFVLENDDLMLKYTTKQKGFRSRTRRQKAIVEGIERTDKGVTIKCRDSGNEYFMTLLDEDFNGQVLDLLKTFFLEKRDCDLPVEAEKLQLNDTFRATANGHGLKFVRFTHQRPKYHLTTLAAISYLAYIGSLIFS